MSMPKKPLSPQVALTRAQDLCARAEHSTGEIRQKLARWGITAADADKVVAALTAHRFLDDERFARAYARDKLQFAHWGRRKIRLGLYQKRIDSSMISQALADIEDETYADILRHVLDAKARTMADADTYEGRTKLFRHALARGFEPDLVSRLISQMPR